MKKNLMVLALFTIALSNNVFSMNLIPEGILKFTAKNLGWFDQTAAKKGLIIALPNKKAAIEFGKKIVLKIKKAENSELQELLLQSLFESLKAYSIANTSDIGNDSLILFDCHILPILKKIKIHTIPKRLRTISKNITTELSSTIKKEANSWTRFLIDTKKGQDTDVKGVFTTQAYGINSFFYLLEKTSPINDARKAVLANTYIKYIQLDEGQKPKVTINKLFCQALLAQKNQITIKNNEITITKPLFTHTNSSHAQKTTLLIDYDSIGNLFNLGPITIDSLEEMKKIITRWVKKYALVKPVLAKNQQNDILTILATQNIEKSGRICQFKTSPELIKQIKKHLKEEQEKYKILPITQLFQKECYYSDVIAAKAAKQKTTPNPKICKIIDIKTPPTNSKVVDKNGETISESDKQKIALSIYLADPDKKHIRVKK